MTRISRFRFRPVAAGEGLCGQPAWARQPGGGLPDKKSAGFCTDESPNQTEKAARSPGFPRFPASGKFLCGRNFPSLRQDANFFQQRNFVWGVRRWTFCRRNAIYEHFPGVFPACFLTFAFRKLPGRDAAGRRMWRFPFHFGSEMPFWVTRRIPLVQ